MAAGKREIRRRFKDVSKGDTYRHRCLGSSCCEQVHMEADVAKRLCQLRSGSLAAEKKKREEERRGEERRGEKRREENRREKRREEKRREEKRREEKRREEKRREGAA